MRIAHVARPYRGRIGGFCFVAVILGLMTYVVMGAIPTHKPPSLRTLEIGCTEDDQDCFRYPLLSEAKTLVPVEDARAQ